MLPQFQPKLRGSPSLTASTSILPGALSGMYKAPFIFWGDPTEQVVPAALPLLQPRWGPGSSYSCILSFQNPDLRIMGS